MVVVGYNAGLGLVLGGCGKKIVGCYVVYCVAPLLLLFFFFFFLFCLQFQCECCFMVSIIFGSVFVMLIFCGESVEARGVRLGLAIGQCGSFVYKFFVSFSRIVSFVYLLLLLCILLLRLVLFFNGECFLVLVDKVMVKCWGCMVIVRVVLIVCQFISVV